MPTPLTDFAHTLDVRQRLTHLRDWYDQWETQITLLDQRMDALI